MGSDKGGNLCFETDDSLVCTETPGHDGDHIAWGLFDTDLGVQRHEVHRWALSGRNPASPDHG